MKRFLIGAALGAALTLTSAAQVWAAAPNGAEALLENAQAVMNADPALALQQAEEAALLAPGAGHGAGLARAQWLKGEALLRLNRPGEAQTALENALGALRPQADAILYAKVLVGIANCHAADGQTGQATTELRRAFDLFRKAGDLRSQATTLIDLGALYEESGRPHEALDAYARAAAVYRADSAVSLAAHNNRANVLKAVGRYEEARDEFRTALRLAIAMNSPTLEIRVLANLAAADVLCQDLASADRDIEQGLALAADDAGAKEWRPFLYGVAAQAAEARGDTQRASESLSILFNGVDLDATPVEYRDFHKLAAKVFTELADANLAGRHQAAYRRLNVPS